MVENAFQWESTWRKVIYRFEMVNGIECIVSDGRKEVTYYNPLEIEGLSKRPNKPTENNVSPEVALARIDVNKKVEILNFVNRFGLLGLWAHPKYCKAEGLEGFEYSRLINQVEYSNWYRHPRKMGIYGWMEPLQLFVKAVHDYQTLLDKTTAVEETIGTNLDTEGEVSFPVNHFWREQLKGAHLAPIWDGGKWSLGWEYQSLLSALYLKIALNKVAGKMVRRCRKKRCGKFYIDDHKDNGFCSEHCKVAFYTASSKNQAAKRELLVKYSNEHDYEQLSLFIDLLLKEGVSGKGRLEKKILRDYINKRLSE
ncbi:hypothetical protein [Neobacillus sp. PS2-9]|uniref:hypothetical protein n=1 Tax=Neobacillus sp. PS2-9 TaxID=3070676 RepID=UPI0027DFFDAE|nr:hypothetical protein [Neobacillus sp. PS2-9]WML56669.1 hypothetical protein RCG25_17265 [Neobacillus sp. PS2-9]